MAAGAVSLRKSHDIIILSFCNIVKGQANYGIFREVITEFTFLKILSEYVKTGQPKNQYYLF